MSILAKTTIVYCWAKSPKWNLSATNVDTAFTLLTFPAKVTLNVKNLLRILKEILIRIFFDFKLIGYCLKFLQLCWEFNHIPLACQTELLLKFVLYFYQFGKRNHSTRKDDIGLLCLMYQFCISRHHIGQRVVEPIYVVWCDVVEQDHFAVGVCGTTHPQSRLACYRGMTHDVSY